MIIKGSLLMSLPTIERLGRNFSKSIKLFFFGGVYMGKNFGVEVGTPPRKSIPTETRRLTQNGGNTVKNVLSRGEQEVRKKYKKVKKHLNMVFHPYAGAALRGRFLPFLACEVTPPT